MKERDFYADVRRWVIKTISAPCAVELKLVKGKKFSPKSVKPHQYAALNAVLNDNFSYKIPDAGYDQKPFDLFTLKNAEAFVGVIFYEPRKKKRLYLIHPSWLEESDSSYTEDQCFGMASYVSQDL